MKMNDYGGPAFPTLHIPDASPPAWSGMTLRQYAAIHLKVPSSGTEWLDEMIEEANKLDREMLTGQKQSNTL